jgi:hypothetical protein
MQQQLFSTIDNPVATQQHRISKTEVMQQQNSSKRKFSDAEVPLKI